MRTRLVVSVADADVLVAVGKHLGSLAGADLARRCGQGRLDHAGRAASRRDRKRDLTSASSSRWAGTITRTSEDTFQLALRNLVAEERSLRARSRRIRRRLAVPVGGRRGQLAGFATPAEHFEKRRRLQVLERRLVRVEERLEVGRVSVCRGGRRLARVRQHLNDAGLDDDTWRQLWDARRLFLTADGEADKAWGNETIRFHPEESWLELRLPTALAHLANRPHHRYRLSCPVTFSYRGEEVAAQAASGAIRYDICFDPKRRRWYLDASWKRAGSPGAILDLAELRRRPVLAVDLNAGHLAALVLDPCGNPLGRPSSIALELDGLPASQRDGLLRAAISDVLKVALDQGCSAIVIEDLDFADAREAGRENTGRRPSRGRPGRRFRRCVAGIPTARFRARLVQMATNRALSVVAVDPAYTSQWGAEHWLAALKQISPTATGHHAAALVIGRRGLGQRARRRGGCASNPPEDGSERATDSAVWAAPASTGLSATRTREPGSRGTRGQPHPRRKTRPASRASPDDQDGEDRSRHPELAMSSSLLR
ncbi:MAG TPA: hypothetical protein VK277_06310 [Acidimicrobiales bacterium]|nr:hypothetical protein [Acidimicrobiales bacterium]